MPHAFAGDRCEWGSRKYIIASCDQSVKRTGVAYFDIFYSHRPDPHTPLEETMGALDTLVEQGKALYVVPADSRPAREWAAARVTSKSRAEKKRILSGLHDLARARGQTLAHMALAFILRHKGMVSAVMGATRPEQVAQNVAALATLDFSSDELGRIDTLTSR